MTSHLRTRLLAIMALVCGVPGVLIAAAPPAEDTAATYLSAAEALYAWNCSVCHGATGGGLAEAKLAFPADHRDCSRCHRPSNRVVQPLREPFNDNDMFSIGEPPKLHGAEAGVAMAAVADPVNLHAYIAATMPRYDPGRLDDEDYWALTALLLDMNGRTEESIAI